MRKMFKIMAALTLGVAMVACSMDSKMDNPAEGEPGSDREAYAVT